MNDELPGKKYASDIVTRYSMEKPRPRLEEGERERASSSLPQALAFELANGVTLTVTLDREVSIGRRSRPEDPQVVLDLQEYGGYQQGVSRFHAMISVVREEIILRDLTSVNGTYLNGYKLSPVKRYALSDGDVVTFGQLPAKIRFIYG
jgi:hypothetical protein